MKSRLITPLVIIALLMSQSCDLTREEFNKITPYNFYKTERDATQAVTALYVYTHSMLTQASSSLAVADHSADMARGTVGTAWDDFFNHNWGPVSTYATDNLIKFHSEIQKCRIVAREIEAMKISDAIKNPLIAEANAIAGFIAYCLYDWYGPLPYPTEEMLSDPQTIEYPPRPTFEEMVTIIENLFSLKSDLMDPDFGSNFGRINKGIANTVLMKLYMLEAGRTGDAGFYQKAKSLGEEIVSSGWYKLENSYFDVFSIAKRKNREIIYARPCEPGSPSVQNWHAQWLPNNYPSALNRGVKSWGVFRLIWSFYDTFDQNDLRLETMAAEYVTDAGVHVTRENPVSDRHGVGIGPVGVKYEIDPNIVGNSNHHDLIVYRYSDVLLLMAEILNELGTNSNVNAPLVQQVAKDGTNLQSDGGTSAFSYINSIRVRAGLNPFPNDFSKSQLRDSILMERGHELWAEGMRRTDLIRYQRVTNGQGYKVYDAEEHKLLMPIPQSYIDEYRGNVKQNLGY